MTIDVKENVKQYDVEGKSESSIEGKMAQRHLFSSRSSIKTSKSHKNIKCDIVYDIFTGRTDRVLVVSGNSSFKVSLVKSEFTN